MGGPKVKRWRYLAAVLASAALLSFLGGAYVVQFKRWPYPLIWKLFVATHALEVQLLPAGPGRFGHSFYTRVSTLDTGVRRHDPERAYEGVTLFTSGHSQRAYLVAMDGEIVHEWHLPFSRVWSAPPHLDGADTPDDLITWRKAHLMPNGELLAVYAGVGMPWGYGLARMDAKSQLIWKYDAHVHHDVEVGPDGTIYTLAHEVLTEPIAGLADQLTPPLIEDYLVVLSSEGRERQVLAVSDAFRGSSYAALLHMPRPNLKGDLWHANAIEPLTPALADRFPQFEAGQVLVSLLGADCLAVVDLHREKVVWAVLGPWRAQHDPDFLPSGNILLFDNHGHLGPGGRSRVVEFEPTSLATVWQYAGTDDDPLFSKGRGSQQRLPNGNTLITDSYGGRLLEVTTGGAVVWEYVSPFRAPHDHHLAGHLHWAQRFAPDDLEFELAGPMAD